MIHPCSSSRLLTHFQFSFYEKFSFYERQNKITIHTWKIQDIKLAELHINLKEHTFKLISLNYQQTNQHLVPDLTKCLAKIFHHSVKEDSQLTPCLDVLFRNDFTFEMKKKIVQKWIKHGGDPNLILFKEDTKLANSLVVFCLEDIQLVEDLLDHGLNPDRICYAIIIENKWITATMPLSILAFHTERYDIMTLLCDKKIPLNILYNFATFCPSIANAPDDLTSTLLTAIVNKKSKMVSFLLEKEKIDFNAPANDHSSYLIYAIQSGNLDIVNILLKKGACFLPHASLRLIMELMDPEKKRVLLDLLIDFFSIKDFKEIELLFWEDFILLVESIARKHHLTPPSTEIIRKFHQNIVYFKQLGHKFGIPITMDLNILSLNFSCSTESNNIQDSNQLKNSMHESITEFLKMNPDSLPHSFFQLFNEFCFNEKLKLDKAIQLIDKFKGGSMISLTGDWPKHHVQIFLYQNLLVVCNRGMHREKNTKPGIHIYQFKDRQKLTAACLLEISSSPEFITDLKKRESVGLDSLMTVWKEREQPGDFCSWNNLKLGLKFLFALSFMPKEFNEQELHNTLYECYQKAQKIYKSWAQYDRERTVNQALKFYEQNSDLTLPISLLLMTLANYKGRTSNLFNFLYKQNLKTSDFMIKDQNGKNLLHYLSNDMNALDLTILLEKNAPEQALHIWNTMVKQVCHDNTTPLLHALIRDKNNVAKELLSWNFTIESHELAWIFLHVSWNPSEVEGYQRAGIKFATRDNNQRTGLHYAIEKDSLPLVKFFIEKMGKEFFKTQDDLEEYIKFAQERSSQSLTLLQEQKKAMDS